MSKSCRDFSYYCLLPKNNHWKQDQWCTEHFGKRWSVIDNRSGVWCTFWRGREGPDKYEWFFQNEQDYLLFVIRWS